LTAAFKLRKSLGTANYSLSLRWTAGHVNIEGIERADKEAKKVAEGTMSDRTLLSGILKKLLKHNKSAAKQAHNSKLKTAWSRKWKKSPRAQRLKHTDPSIPSSKFLKLISNPDISRKGASWLYQMRIGHIPLNAYLFRVKRAENASYPACGHYKEITQHFLLDCPTYAHERWPLLAGESQRNQEYAKLLEDTKNAIPLIDYIQATGRFKQDAATNGGGTYPAEGSRETAGQGQERETGSTNQATTQLRRHHNTSHTYRTTHPHDSLGLTRAHSRHEVRRGRRRTYAQPDRSESDQASSIKHQASCLTPRRLNRPATLQLLTGSTVTPLQGSGGDIRYWSRKCRSNMLTQLLVLK
jgi:hypothetical protein